MQLETQVQVPGRAADERQLAALHRALDKHYHLSTGQKVAEFFEGVKTSVQVRTAAVICTVVM
jgi:hypothetical protein